MPTRRINTHYFQDEAGRIYIVDEYENFTIAGSMGRPSQEVALQKTIRLRGGGAVNYIDDDTFEIAEGNVRITRQ